MKFSWLLIGLSAIGCGTELASTQGVDEPPISRSDVLSGAGCQSKLEIFAAGTPVGGVYPIMQLRVRGTPVATFADVRGNPSERRFQRFAYRHAGSISPSEVEVMFVNDISSPSEDRNLVVDRIVLDGLEFQTEASTTYSTGTWSDPDACGAGYKSSETLHCNGGFRYGEQPTVISIDAAGIYSNASYPRMELRIDGRPVNAWYVAGDPTGRRFTRLSHQENRRVRLNEIEIAFTNDDGAGRDLLIDRVFVDGLELQTEDPQTLSNGTWTSGNACAAGRKQSEWLHCNGGFRLAEVPTLRASAGTWGRGVGTAVSPDQIASPFWAQKLRRDFSSLTPENHMKWELIHPAPAIYDFSGADTIVSFARENGLAVRGHTLVWHGQLPSWLLNLRGAAVHAALDAHIRTVVRRYRNQVAVWDVVNEAIADDGEPGAIVSGYGVRLRRTFFLEQLGENYIEEAFRIVAQEDPSASLFYNDYGAEGLNTKSDHVYRLVSHLRSRGVPVHGVGFQTHVHAGSAPSGGAVEQNIIRLAAIGLRTHITEMDVQIRGMPGSFMDRLLAQQRVYQDIVGACSRQASCTSVTFWGFTDARSWIDASFGPDDPLLLDDYFAPKPSYFGVETALRTGVCSPF